MVGKQMFLFFSRLEQPRQKILRYVSPIIYITNIIIYNITLDITYLYIVPVYICTFMYCRSINKTLRK